MDPFFVGNKCQPVGPIRKKLVNYQLPSFEISDEDPWTSSGLSDSLPESRRPYIRTGLCIGADNSRHLTGYAETARAYPFMALRVMCVLVEGLLFRHRFRVLCIASADANSTIPSRVSSMKTNFPVESCSSLCSALGY